MPGLFQIDRVSSSEQALAEEILRRDAVVFQPGLPALPELADAARPIALHLGCACGTSDYDSFHAATAGFGRVETGGMATSALHAIHGDAVFLGSSDDVTLARAFCSAAVVVSTCSCGLGAKRIVAALACGAPVAALPGEGACSVIGADGRGPDGELPMTIGAIDADLGIAIACATRLDRRAVAVAGARLAARAGSAEILQSAAVVPPALAIEALHAA